MQKLDEIQKEYQTKAQELCTLMSQFHTCEVIKGEDRTDFHVKMQVADDFFKVTRNYDNNIIIQLYEYERYTTVSSHTRGEVYKKYKTNNMKVPTLKKVVEHVNACTRERDELRALEKKNLENRRMFLCDIDALKLPVSYEYDTEYYTDDDGRYTTRKTGIKAGTIVRNGIQYHFEFCDDGYISQKVSLYYGVDNTINDFVKLSENKYSK